jgi:hypothetical protein
MLKDIPELKVEDVSIAIIKDEDEVAGEVWDVYLINQRKEKITGVLVTSTGYGFIGDESRKTSTLRHFFEEVDSNSFIKIETMVEDVFDVNNEFWLRYFLGNNMYDKKFIFVAGSIKEENFTKVPLVHKSGVLIK